MADPNDTDAVFVAEAEMDAKALRSRTGRTTSRSSTAGERVAVAARGGIDSRFSEDLGEDQPLLNKAKDGGDGGGGGAEWIGTKEFDGLPWYKRPSVSVLIWDVYSLAC